MKPVIKIFIISLIFFSTKILAQIEEDWPGYKISIPFIREVELRTLYKQGELQTLPHPHNNTRLTEISGYEFLLELTISIHSSNKFFDKIVPLVFFTPDGKKTIYNFNREQAQLQTNNLYTFTITIQSKRKGYTQVGFLRKFSNSTGPQEVYENGLRLE